MSEAVEMQHTPDRLRWTGSDDDWPSDDEWSGLIVAEADDTLVCEVFADESSIAEAAANAARLVACWNACTGIRDPESLRKQRDELLAALKNLLRESSAFTKARLSQYGEEYRLTDAEEQAQATIAKAESL
jgi:hypothetical protein